MCRLLGLSKTKSHTLRILGNLEQDHFSDRLLVWLPTNGLTCPRYRVNVHTRTGGRRTPRRPIVGWASRPIHVQRSVPCPRLRGHGVGRRTARGEPSAGRTRALCLEPASVPFLPLSALRHYPPDDRGSAPRSRHPTNRGPGDTELSYTILTRKASKKTSHLRGFVKKAGSRVDKSPPCVWSAVTRHRFPSPPDIALAGAE
jgi:hypothetical protein